jgi:TyrR family helix-turn-helix protein
VETEDRIGMVRDIVAELAACGGNVEAMEVVARIVYVRFRLASRETVRLRQRMQAIPGVRAIREVERLPFEADEDRLIRRVMFQESRAERIIFDSLIYVSDAMRRVVQLAQAVAASDAPILICGETGTGKELLARAIHNASRYGQGRFVPVNCAAIPDALLESELFGYADGAFTGAKRGGHPGLFEVADGGTLFLDEIGEMNLAVQAKLLRALADGEVRRVGSTQARHVRTRVLAATNRDLPALVQSGRFREDLYYRLNVIPITIPPLRDRREDVLSLAEDYLGRMARRQDRAFVFDETARQALLAYDYPGNVRELQNLIERACYLADGPIISAHHLLIGELPGTLADPPGKRQQYTGDGAGAIADRDVDEGECDAVGVSDAGEGDAAVSPNARGADGRSLREQVRAFERELIQRTIAETGSVRKAARRLGVSHTTLLNKMRG